MNEFILWAFPTNLDWYYYLLYLVVFVFGLFSVFCTSVGLWIVWQETQEQFSMYLNKIRFNRFSDGELVLYQTEICVLKKRNNVFWLEGFKTPFFMSERRSTHSSILDIKKLTKEQKLELL